MRRVNPTDPLYVIPPILDRGNAAARVLMFSTIAHPGV
jgi:hypothetical protein